MSSEVAARDDAGSVNSLGSGVGVTVVDKFFQPRSFGFSALDRAVVLAIVVILVGLLLPAVRTWRIYRESAAARIDIRTISSAIQKFVADVGLPPSRNSRGDDRSLLRLAGPGVIAAGSYYVPDEFQGSLAAHLVENTPTRDPSKAYADWHGPYLAELHPDPWGAAYIVVVYPMNLAANGVTTALAHGGARQQAVVVSAGANGRMDGSYANPRAPVAAGDDLLETIAVE